MEVKKLVPELRFKEFFNIWDYKKISDITNVTSGGTPSTLTKEYWGGEIPWMNSGELNLKKVLRVENRITDLGLKKSSTKIIPIKSILIGLAGQGRTRGTAAMNLIELCINQSIAAILPNNEEFIPEFLYLNIDSRYDELRKLSTGDGGRGGLNLQIIKSFFVPIPSLAEQQKIAYFLSAVDEKIQQLTRKKELLELYKKGVMQQLFSGKLRFKDDTSTELSARNGKDYADWEEKRLGDVCVKKSSNIAANKIEENFGDYVIYGASGILKKVDFYKEENNYISIVKDGAGVGRLLFCKGKSSVLGTMEMIIPKKGIDTYFLYSLLSNIDFVKYITGSTIPHIYFKDYSSESCGMPCLEEQQKIANFLSSIDSKIESASRQITQTQTFKKGLLQKMFV
jgi:type I restriction enzyme S subunit